MYSLECKASEKVADHFKGSRLDEHNVYWSSLEDVILDLGPNGAKEALADPRVGPVYKHEDDNFYLQFIDLEEPLIERLEETYNKSGKAVRVFARDSSMVADTYKDTDPEYYPELMKYLE